MVPSSSGWRQQLPARPYHMTTKLRDVTTQKNITHTKRLAKTNYLNASIFSLEFDPLSRRRATNRKVAGSIPDGVIGIFH